MFVQGKAVRVVVDRALVNHGLAVIFALVIQVGQFEQAIGRGIEIDMPDLFGNRGVVDGQWPVFNQARVAEPGLARSRQEVLPVKGPGQAFTEQDRVLL